MIRVVRGDEPVVLRSVREKHLSALRGLGRQPQSGDIDGYQVAGEHLWRRQRFKCCYCEQKIRLRYNDVEHYRPKGRAERGPGCSHTHGYWWLAYSWENLLFACPSCNRSSKSSRFPLAPGSVSLRAEEGAPGAESPLLIDPGSNENPVQHIEFVWEADTIGGPLYWWARPRNGSPLGAMTIDICGLNDPELRELRNDHVETIVKPQVKAIREAALREQPHKVLAELERALYMIAEDNPFVALTYDALRSLVPEKELVAKCAFHWPGPEGVPFSVVRGVAGYVRNERRAE